MVAQWDGEMLGKNRIRIQQKVILLQHGEAFLLFWTVHIAKEARTALDGFWVNVCPCRDDACRIVLCHQTASIDVELADCYMSQLVVAFASSFPICQLRDEQGVCVLVRGTILPIFVQSATVDDFHRAQAVLINIVAIDFVRRQRCVAVAFPTTAEVQFVVDSANLILTAESQTYRIIFSVGSVGHANLSEQRREESARSAQTVDAQGIVVAVLWRPLTMVDEARGQGLELEVAHAIGTNHHSAMLFIELVDDALQSVRSAVEVVAVQLHGKASATQVVESETPATTDAQVSAFWDDVDNTRILRCQLLNHLRRAISGMIVHHHHVEFERGAL